MRNVQQALKDIDARYCSKASEMGVKAQPSRASSISSSEPTGQLAVDRLAKGLEQVLAEFKKVSSRSLEQRQAEAVESHFFRVV
jgi:sirohydrochlorin ferrochelatase